MPIWLLIVIHRRRQSGGVPDSGVTVFPNPFGATSTYKGGPI